MEARVCPSGSSTAAVYTLPRRSSRFSVSSHSAMVVFVVGGGGGGCGAFAGDESDSVMVCF